ncbi:MAG: phosphatidate cytidylyltransferase [Anaerolineae bacterium]|nr:phosphatidate cytidylyltransferase [Anaerolineae bacterium]
MFHQRAVSALVVLLIVIAATLVGGWLYFAILSLVLLGGAVEFTRLAARETHTVYGVLISLLILLILFDRQLPDLGLFFPGMALLLLATMFWSLFHFGRDGANAFLGYALTVSMGLYLGWLGAYFISLRAMPDGTFIILMLIVAVAATDTGAYLVGKQFGRTPFMPIVSPRKTWEGYAGGIVSSTVLTSAFILLWRALGATSPLVTPIHGLMIGLLVSIIGPFGDLSMSMVKRYAHAKDAGDLIPGHGGLLDRFDTMLVAGVVAYYYLIVVTALLPA